MIRRFSTSVLMATLVTFGLFFLMQHLVRMGSGENQEILSGPMVDFVRLPKDEDLNLKRRRKPNRPKQKKPPPPPRFKAPQAVKPLQNVDMTGPGFGDINVKVEMSGLSEDQDVLPLFRIPPQYPRRAEARGIEGWVELQFGISKTGAVIDPIVVDAYPPSIFNRAAIRALLKWKYKPRIEDGKPVERHGIRVLITFELEDEGRRGGRGGR